MTKLSSIKGKNRFKVTDVIAHMLAKNGASVVFGVSGGAALHILHSINVHPELKLITTHHEQAAAMAAESTSRISDSLGVAVSTSGPGATNLITGIAGSFYDSVPCIYITGQVSTTRLSGNVGVRQIGFQETPIVEMVEKITKHAVQVTIPENIVSDLETCIQIAISGRQGPVLIDIPDDIQRMYIELPEGLPNKKVVPIDFKSDLILREQQISKLSQLISKSERPVIVIGWGVHLSKKEIIIRDVLDQLKWPTLLTWGAADFLEEGCDYRIGTFGTHGNRDSNFIVQNSDLILSLGSRLDTKSTGTPASSFGRKAKLIMIDIDNSEITKFENLDRKVDLALNLDMRDNYFHEILSVILNSAKPVNFEWNKYVKDTRKLLTRKLENKSNKYVNPYDFMIQLSELSPNKIRIFVDTGCAIAWTTQVWRFKKEQRLFHDFNNTAMGWALPAAMASLVCGDGYQTLAIIGDGSFMMSIQELATARNLGMPLKIFLLNNSGYSMIKQTQDQWFDSDYVASDSGPKMSFPNYIKIAQAFEYEYRIINGGSVLINDLVEVLNSKNSVLCEVLISPDARVVPQVKFGSPIEGMEPEISSEITKNLMIIDL